MGEVQENSKVLVMGNWEIVNNKLNNKNTEVRKKLIGGEDTEHVEFKGLDS